VITKGDEVIDRHKVLLFLHLMKMAAHERFVFTNRAKNLETLASLGITREHAESLVLGMQPGNYVSGPDRDRNNPSLEMWVFGLRVASSEVYVKLQVISDPPVQCVCVSFHEPERPMHYPLREAGPPANEEESR
jgi:hypothetical protein